MEGTYAFYSFVFIFFLWLRYYMGSKFDEIAVSFTQQNYTNTSQYHSSHCVFKHIIMHEQR